LGSKEKGLTNLIWQIMPPAASVDALAAVQASQLKGFRPDQKTVPEIHPEIPVDQAQGHRWEPPEVYQAGRRAFMPIVSVSPICYGRSCKSI